MRKISNSELYLSTRETQFFQMDQANEAINGKDEI